MDDTPWLSTEEQRLWRTWLALSSLLPVALHRNLQADAGLSLPDVDVLVRLSETEDGRVRVTALAHSLGWERSRLSHHVARMQRRGLVAREDCADDGRGAFVVLTDAGRRAIVEAAPHHVRTVRRLVFAALDEGDVELLSGILERVLGKVSREVGVAP